MLITILLQIQDVLIHFFILVSIVRLHAPYVDSLHSFLNPQYPAQPGARPIDAYRVCIQTVFKRRLKHSCQHFCSFATWTPNAILTLWPPSDVSVCFDVPRSSSRTNFAQVGVFVVGTVLKSPDNNNELLPGMEVCRSAVLSTSDFHI